MQIVHQRFGRRAAALKEHVCRMVKNTIARIEKYNGA